MRVLAVLLFLATQPFWETKPPEQWTDREVDLMLHASPWSQVSGDSPEIVVYLATAEPVAEAESELRVRSPKPVPELDPDYIDYVREHRDDAFVLAIPYEKHGFGNAEDQHRLEDETLMTAGGRKYHLLGYFPPTPSDPVLRLIFPRQVRPTDKTVHFTLYLPGIPFPDRDVEFRVRDLYYKGKLTL